MKRKFNKVKKKKIKVWNYFCDQRSRNKSFLKFVQLQRIKNFN